MFKKFSDLKSYLAGFRTYFYKPESYKLNFVKIGVLAVTVTLVVGVSLLHFSKKAKAVNRSYRSSKIVLLNYEAEKLDSKFRSVGLMKTPVSGRSTLKSTPQKTQGTTRRRRNTKTQKNEPVQSQQTTSSRKQYPNKVIIYDESGANKSFLEEGTLIPAKLITSVVMKDTKVPVRFKVIEDVYDDKGNILITSGSLALGTISGFNDQGRAFGKINRVKIIGEKIQKVSADILSSDESYGLSGIFYDEKGKYLAGSIIGSFVGTFAEGFKGSMVTELGGKLAQYSTGNLKNAFLNALEKTALQEAKRSSDNLKDVKPFVVVPKGVNALLLIGLQ